MPSAYKMHSDFGYICLSPNLRRKVGLALALIVSGSIAGASGIFVQMADEPNTNGASMIAAIPLNSSATLSTSIVLPASPAASAPDSRRDPALPSNSAQAAPVDAMITSATEPAATTAVTEPAVTEAAQQSVAASKKPQSATLSISIVSPASPTASAPDSRRDPTVLSNSVQAVPVDAMTTEATEPADTTAVTEPAVTEAAQQSVAASKKPQKTARQNRRDRDLYDAYALRQQRADYGRGRVSGNNYSGAGW
jgi:hypothetical protein